MHCFLERITSAWLAEFLAFELRPSRPSSRVNDADALLGAYSTDAETIDRRYRQRNYWHIGIRPMKFNDRLDS